MRNRLIGTIATVALLLGSGAASAQTNTDTASVNFTISAVSLIDIAADVDLTIDSVTSVGGGLADATDTTTYAITNNQSTMKLVGKIDSTITDADIKVNVTAPSSGTSAGTVTLSTTDQDLVTAVGTTDQSGVDMTFTLSATVSAGVVSGTKTFTMTLTSGA